MGIWIILKSGEKTQKWAFQLQVCVSVWIKSKNYFVLFTDPRGKVHPEITNKNGNPNYKYFYSTADQGNYPRVSVHPSWFLFSFLRFPVLLHLMQMLDFEKVSGKSWTLARSDVCSKNWTTPWLASKDSWFLLEQSLHRRYKVERRSSPRSRLVSDPGGGVGNLWVLQMWFCWRLRAETFRVLLWEKVERSLLVGRERLRQMNSSSKYSFLKEEKDPGWRVIFSSLRHLAGVEYVFCPSSCSLIFSDSRTSCLCNKQPRTCWKLVKPSAMCRQT